MPGDGNPNPPDKPGQRVIHGNNVVVVLEQARVLNAKLASQGFDTEATVVISAYKEQ